MQVYPLATGDWVHFCLIIAPLLVITIFSQLADRCSLVCN